MSIPSGALIEGHEHEYPSSTQQQMLLHPQVVNQANSEIYMPTTEFVENVICQESTTNVSGLSTRDLNVSGNVASIINYINLEAAKKSTEPQLKLMFQVKDPIESFTGRKEFLEDLHNSIEDRRNKGEMISILSQTSSITGLGGVGKSETVRMYIKQFCNEYHSIVWIDAEYPSEAITQMENLAFQKLHVNSKDHNDKPREFSDVLTDVYEILCRKPNLLLIVFDNAEALDDTASDGQGIRQFLPPQTSTIEPPVVLITSRQQNWEDMKMITLDLWQMDDCMEFIFNRLHLENTPENNKDAEEFAETFGRLPIVKKLALSVVTEQSKIHRAYGTGDYGMKDLITEYRKDSSRVLTKKQSQISTMEVLLKVSINKIKALDHGELAVQILAFMAYLSPTKIPKKLITEALMKGNHQEEVGKALVLLQEYSIIDIFPTHFTIHRVFQEVIITNLSVFKISKDKLKILNDLINKITIYIPVLNPDQGDYSDIITNIVHLASYTIRNSLTLKFYNYIETVADLIKSVQMEKAIAFYNELINCDEIQKLPSEKIFKKLTAIADIQFENGKHEKALDTYNKLLQKQLNSSEVKDNDHRQQLQVICTKFGIAKCHYNLGNKEEALNHYNAVHHDQEEILGSRDPHTLRTKLNIAVCLNDLCKKEKALNVFKSGYTDQEEVLGPHHQETLKTKVNMALCLNGLGRKEEALELYKTSHEDQEKALGSRHPETLITKMNMADCLFELGKREEALNLYEAVYKDREEALGPLHQDTLTSKKILAYSLSDLGKKVEALKLYEAVSNDLEEVHGLLHPITLRNKVSVAVCLSDLGKKMEALELLTTIHDVQEKVLGHLHPETLRTNAWIFVCLNDLGKHDEAVNFYAAFHVDQENVLGPLAPDVLTTKMHMAICQRDLGNREEALKLFEAVHDDQEKVRGSRHPDTLQTKVNTAVCLSGLGKNREALTLYKSVQEDQEKVLGFIHPETLRTKVGVVECLNELGQYGKALELSKSVHHDLEKVLGRLHLHTLATKINMANSLRHLGKMMEALELYKAVHEDQVKVLGSFHQETLKTKMNTALCLNELCKNDEAYKLYTTVHRDQEKVLGPHHPHTLTTKINMGLCVKDLKAKEKMLKQLKTVHKACEKDLGALHLKTLVTKLDMADCLSCLGKNDEEFKLYNALHADLLLLYCRRHPSTLQTKISMAFDASRLGNKEEVSKLFDILKEDVAGSLHPENCEKVTATATGYQQDNHS